MKFKMEHDSNVDYLAWKRPNWRVYMFYGDYTGGYLIHLRRVLNGSGSERIDPVFLIKRHASALMTLMWIVNALGSIPDEDVEAAWMWLADRDRLGPGYVGKDVAPISESKILALHRNVKPGELASLLQEYKHEVASR